MSLNIYQKSVYAGLFNSTMIGRSVGKTFKKTNKKLDDFRLTVLYTSENLIDKMDKNILSEKDIINSLDELTECFKVSYGQSQKAVNVILKYHYQLYKEFKNYDGSVLHCPLDSTILKELGRNYLSLSKIDKQNYLLIQDEIKTKSRGNRVDFDKLYEEKYVIEKIGWKN